MTPRRVPAGHFLRLRGQYRLSAFPHLEPPMDVVRDIAATQIFTRINDDLIAGALFLKHDVPAIGEEVIGRSVRQLARGPFFYVHDTLQRTSFILSPYSPRKSIYLSPLKGYAISARRPRVYLFRSEKALRFGTLRKGSRMGAACYFQFRRESSRSHVQIVGSFAYCSAPHGIAKSGSSASSLVISG